MKITHHTLWIQAKDNSIKSHIHTLSEVPRITYSLEDERDRLVGEMNLTYICEFEGYPLPNLAFYFNGARIPTNNTNGIIYIVGNKLIIRSAQVSHSGIYQCIVSNEFGDDQQAWLLEIRQPSKWD